MESIYPRGSIPTMQDRFLTINGTCPFIETTTQSARVGTKLRTIYGVYFQARHFEEQLLMPQLPYDLGTAADGTKYFDFQIPAGYNVSYFIVGSEAIEAQELNVELTILDDDVPLDLNSKFHNHNGINSPAIYAGFLNVTGAPPNSFVKVNSDSTGIVFVTGTSEPGDFSLTAPATFSSFDADGGGTLAFTWTAASGVVSYDILITDLTAGTANYAGTGVISGMTRNKSSFTNNHSYSWFVTAINGTGTKSSRVYYFTATAPTDGV
jgi:hypothetical protein